MNSASPSEDFESKVAVEPNRPAAIALGMAALVIALAPSILFCVAPDDGGGGGVAINAVESMNWTGLRWFATASLAAFAPCFWLIKAASDRANDWLSRLPSRLALVATLPLIPGALLRAAWLVWFLK